MAYIYWLSIFIWLPLIVMWAINWRYLLKYKGTFLSCVVWTIIFSIPWDIWAVLTQIWIFPKGGILNVWFYGLTLGRIFIYFDCPSVDFDRYFINKKAS